MSYQQIFSALNFQKCLKLRPNRNQFLPEVPNRDQSPDLGTYGSFRQDRTKNVCFRTVSHAKKRMGLPMILLNFCPVGLQPKTENLVARVSKIDGPYITTSEGSYTSSVSCPNLERVEDHFKELEERGFGRKMKEGKPPRTYHRIIWIS